MQKTPVFFDFQSPSLALSHAHKHDFNPGNWSSLLLVLTIGIIDQPAHLPY
jgi:hypothetical protein